MPNTTVRAAAEGMPKSNTPQSSDTVVIFGRLLGEAYRASEAAQTHAFDAKRKNDMLEESAWEDAAAVEDDRIYALRDMLSLHVATSLEGVAIHLAEALTRIDFVRDQFPEVSESYQIKQDFRALNRLVYSALAFIDEQASTKLQQNVTDTFGSKHLSPWTPVEEMLAFCRSAGPVKGGAK